MNSVDKNCKQWGKKRKRKYGDEQRKKQKVTEMEDKTKLAEKYKDNI